MSRVTLGSRRSTRRGTQPRVPQRRFNVFLLLLLSHNIYCDRYDPRDRARGYGVEQDSITQTDSMMPPAAAGTIISVSQAPSYWWGSRLQSRRRRRRCGAQVGMDDRRSGVAQGIVIAVVTHSDRRGTVEQLLSRARIPDRAHSYGVHSISYQWTKV